MKNNSNMYFTRQERKSLLIFALMAFSFLAMLYSIARFSKPKVLPIRDVVQTETAPQWKATVSPKVLGVMDVSKKTKNARIAFKFDPNTIRADSLGLLGVDKKTIRVFEKYRSRGAIFKNQQQFYKVYGMNKYREVLDSLLIFSHERQKGGEFPSGISKEDKVVNKDNIKEQAHIPIVKIKYLDINKADSFEWQLIKGIGPALASRIVRYRENLGGFYDVTQLEEVYGMRPDTYLGISHLLVLDTTLIKKLSINEIDFLALARHPYVGKKRAGILIKYRAHHGRFRNVSDIQSTRLFETDELNKLNPYLDFR